MKLVIVESPSKTKTLKKYLGDDYEIIATKGHIRDLAISGKNGYGVDIENDFKASYSINSDKDKVVKELKSASKKADQVIIATDPDREGEAIAWHLADIIGLDVKTNPRLEFHEITREAITEAVENPRTIDMNLVASQESRRIIDRIIGFGLSKITQKAIKSKSAGRVQSVTLSLICAHEKEILDFVPETYYHIEVLLEKNKYKIALDNYNGQKIDRIKDLKTAEEIFGKISDILTISSIDVKEKRVKSKEPLTTSTLQQEAFNKHGLKTRETQMIAQKLYEGVDTPEGLVGLITYMRTDSTKLSASYVNRAKAFIIDNYGEEYFAGEKNIRNIAGAQDAHEAIRPTSNHRTPEIMKDYLNTKEYNVYKLIYNRAQGSLMTDQIQEVHTILMGSNGVQFKLEGHKVLFDGFTKLNSDKSEKFTLDKLSVGSKLKVENKELTEEQTKPAPRYSEAKVVKLMEEKGIGRPSTYASTIQTLITRNYITSAKGIITPTEQGMLTSKFLDGNFQDFINVEYTAEMEKNLDTIQAGNDSRTHVLNSFYKTFTEEIDQYNKEPKLVVDRPKPKETGEMCPVCGNHLVERQSRFGKFVACENYPNCKYIKKEEKKIEFVGRKCPDCGKELVFRHANKGKSRGKTFIACSGFPKCRYTEFPEADNNTKKDEQKTN